MSGNVSSQIRTLLKGVSLVLIILGVGRWAAEATAAGPEADFFVATDGNDNWSGRLAERNQEGTDGPFASLERARDALRQTGDKSDGDLTVLIRGGTYRLTQTVVFSLQDSADAGHTITYASYPGETACFSAGHLVSTWRKLANAPPSLPKQARGHVWVADVSDFKRKFRALFDGQRRLPRARGDGFIQTNVTPRGSQDYSTVEFPRGAVADLANLTDAELRIIPSHFWIMNLLPIASIDQADQELETALPGTYPLGKNAITEKPTAWIENALEVLDQPGEWALDSQSRLLYFWPPGDRPSDTIAAPLLTELIRVEGEIDYDGPRDDPVRGLVFRNLTFMHGDLYPWHGRTGWGLQHDWECFDKPTALVRFRGAERCAVEDCHLTATGHTAIRFDLHCQMNRVVGCHIHHIGGVGVLLAGYGPGTKNVNRGNEVINNYIHHIGREYWASAAVFAWQSGENRIAHNHIAYLPYTAILSTGRIIRSSPGPGECSRTIRWDEVPRDFATLDWAAREPYLHSRRNRIEYNDVHNVMERLGDGNCIYVSGAGEGNIVQYNYCHDCLGRHMNAVIRCDDDQHRTRMEGNVCARTRGAAEGFISKGDNDIINNFVIDLRQQGRHRAYITFPYGDIHGSRIERNILYSCVADQQPYWHGKASGRRGEPPSLRDAVVDNNLYFSTVDPAWADEHLESQRKAGNEKHSLVADPMFVDVDACDFHFRPGSPATKLGIEPLDVTRAGLESAYRRRLLGRRLRTRITPRDQRFRQPITVRIACNDSQATVFYTLDGTEPTPHANPYRGPFVLSEPATVRARAFAPGANDAVGAAVFYTPPPAPIIEGFETARVGSRTPAATTSEDARLKQYRARVTDQEAFEGEHSLRFSDGPGQRAGYTPHVYYRRTYDEGRMATRLAVRVDAATALNVQWRQYDSDGYVNGPTLSIEPQGRVVYAGRELMRVPTEQWLRVELVAGLGELANGAFELRVWLPDRSEPRVFSGLKCSPKFRRLDWIGLVSKSAQEATFYVDNLEVVPADD